MAEYYRPGYGRPGPIAPLAGIDERLLVQRDTLWNLYRVTGFEAIQPSSATIVNWGAINGGADLADQSLQTPLELGEHELGQFRIRPLDDIRIQVFQPRNLSHFAVKRAVTRVTLGSRLADPCGHLTEVYSYKDEYPFVTITNPTDYNFLLARAVFWGFRYKVQKLAEYQLGELEKIPKPYTAILGEALVRGGGEG